VLRPSVTHQLTLAEAQKAQTELIRKQQELVDAKREMDLQIETRVQDSLHKAKQEALKVSEKEEQTASMQRQIEELELIYQYLSGPRFRRRIEAIVEKFSSMQTDLERERKAMTRLRAKRRSSPRLACMVIFRGLQERH
jgi:hypothetical protein